MISMNSMSLSTRVATPFLLPKILGCFKKENWLLRRAALPPKKHTTARPRRRPPLTLLPPTPPSTNPRPILPSTCLPLLPNPPQNPTLLITVPLPRQ
jgi:hypothetical protein